MQALLRKLKDLNIKIDLVDSELNVQAPKGVMNKELLTEIKFHKSDLLAFLKTYKSESKSNDFISKVSNQEDYALSSSQRRLWLLSQYENGNVAYNMTSVYELTGNLNIDSLTRAFSVLTKRHESLRTSFNENGLGEVRQSIQDVEKNEFKLIYQDVSNETKSLDKAKELIQFEADYSFDLSKGSLIRAKLIKIAEDSHILVFVMHHIISDGWSSEIIAVELFQLYKAFDEGKENPLTELSVQYKDYSDWQQKQLNESSLKEHKSYWLQQFQDEIPTLDLMASKTRPGLKTFAGDYFVSKLDEKLVSEFNQLCIAEGGTLFMGLFALVNLLLHKYTSQKDIIIGTPIAGREYKELQNQIGFFVNTIAIRTRFEEKNSFKELFQITKKIILEGYEHQSYPFDELVLDLNLKRDLSRNPLFDLLITVENSNSFVSNLKEVAGIKVNKFISDEKISSKFDLEFAFRDTEGKLDLKTIFNPDIYSKEYVAKLVNHLNSLLESVIANPDTPINVIPYLSDNEMNQLLVGFNNKTSDTTHDKTIIDLFEEQVLKTPDAIALAFNDRLLTYKELNEESNQLANYLRSELDIIPDDLIGVKLERSEIFIISVIAALKSGAAYVPIDTNYPPERRAYMEEDSNCKLVIDNQEFKKFEEVKFNFSKTNLTHLVNGDNLVYIIYTSGSTGKPKGIMMTHKSMYNLITFHNNEIDDAKKVMQFTSVSFDVSFQEIFTTLTCGATLYPISEAIKSDPIELVNFIDVKKIDTIFLPTSYFKILIENKNFYDFLNNSKTVKNIIVAGEQLVMGNEAIEIIRNSGAKLHNHYGPAETHVITTIILEDDYLTNNPCIGKPITNTQVYILDASLNVVPVGVTGRLYVSGSGLARGYLNREDLTAEKFVSNPFTPGSRMYDTGDLGRWLDDGNIEFLGRNDHQVKIRGFRIELGEIESVILQYSDSLGQVVVEAKDSGSEKVLVAYCVCEGGLDKSALRSFLQDKLPEYMIPGYFVELASLPLTPNGKIDRKQLPGISASDVIQKEYVAPRNSTESALVSIWEEVLGVSNIGITDNFFELGGHSLVVAQVINRVYKQMGKSISFREFFSHPTIEHLSPELRESLYIPISRIEDNDFYTLTPSQHRLWILSQMEGGSLAYNMPAAVRLSGELDKELFSSAFRMLIGRHEILRTVFRMTPSGDIAQYVVGVDDYVMDFDYQDFTGSSTPEADALLYMEQRNGEVFDLEHGPLLRCSLIDVKQDDFVFLISLHHIIGDGWSIKLLVSEIITIYNSLKSGSLVSLPELKIQYRDYSIWVNDRMDDAQFGASRLFWLDQLSGELPVLDLPSFNKRPVIQTYCGASQSYDFSDSFLSKLRDFGTSRDATLFMVLMSGIKSLLHRYTGQNDIIVGTPVAGREHPDLEHQLGLYLNTLAIRSHFGDVNSFEAVLDRERQTLLGCYGHQQYPFDSLVSDLRLKRDTGRSAIFDVLVVLQNQDQVGSLMHQQELTGLEVGHYDIPVKTSKYDINYTFVESSGLTLHIEYNTDIYDRSIIESMFGHFERLMTLAMEDPSADIASIDYLDDVRRTAIVEGFNDTSHPYPSQSTLVDLFEEQVLKTPDAVAVVFGDTELSYSELNCRANRLGHYLRDRFGITSDDLVGIKLERSDQMLVVLLGILKSGGAYVPIDTSYPAERILYIEKDSNCKVVIDAEALREFEKLSDGYSDGNPDRISTADDLAYIIYTSGTTGNPKGVMIEHRSVIRLVKPCLFFPLNKDKVLLSTGAFSFDASIIEYFGTLLNGAKLILTTQEVLLNNEKLNNILKLHKVNSMWMTSSWFNEVLDNEISVFDTIEHLIIGGDIVSAKHVSKLYLSNPTITIINGYGPTENTTFSTTFNIERVDWTNIPIGKPITNTQVYILDASLNVVPVGVTGRLYVSGSGLARGYLNREDLTAEKFVSNPFTPGSRMYDTGDLGRWLDDGNIEFLGRNDHQVKIRGFRIELGEIESVILQYSDSLGQVVVEAKDSGSEKVLVAYCVCEGGLDKSALRSFLQDKLPEYMIPGYFVELASLPLTPNGKIDRKQLPGISASDVIQKEYVAPRNSTESALVSIWEEVLGVSNIGITDNFFELGGHSLVVAQVINRVYKQMGKSISFREFFSHPTIEHLSPELRESLYIPISRIEDNDFYTLTPSQHRLWILSQMEGGSLAYNMPAAVRLSGELDKELFSSAFRMLIGRHEILRTVFRMTPSGDIAQYVVGVDDYVMDFDYQDFTGSSTPEADALLYMEQRNGEVFDLEHGPLLRRSLIDVKQDDFVFLISLHHIIGDGWSIKLLVSEIITIYNSLKSGSLVSLPELKIQYRDYSIWVNDRMDDAQFGASRLFWLDQLSGELPVLDLPSFNKRPVIQTYCGASQSYDFSDSFLSKLRDFGTSRDATLFMVLMSGIKSLLHRYTGQNDIIVGTPVAGREHPDLEHQLGLYLNTLAIRSHFGDVNSFEAVLDRERQTLLGCYGHQQYPFDSLVSDLRLKRDTGRSAIFDVLVVLQNQDQVGSLMHQQELTGLEVGHYDIPVKSSQFDMSFTFAESSGLTLHIEYNTDIYDRSIIESMFGHFERLMTLAMEDPSADIASIDYLDDVQRTAIVEGFNDTSHPYPSQSTLVDLFEEQVLKTPDSVAVVFGDTELSYSELNCRANRLGHYLRDRFGITSDDLVGIKLERSDQMLVVLLGILKSGGAYVPIDTSYPAERILYIEKDSNCKVVIDAETLREFEKLSDEYSDGNPDHISTADDLAYIIYTSGTTGNPKGVMIEHNQVVDYVLTFVDYFKLNKTDSILSLATISFDTSVEEIFPILSVGGKLVMVSSNNDFEHIFSLCNEHSITTLSTNPYTLNYFNSRSNEIDTSLIRVINGGDTLKSQDIDSLINKVEIYNSYGPTETTVCASYYKIEELKENLPIGSPISNKQIYILDASLNVVPVGVTGRLYVSGSGLARGYLNREDLTAEKFVSNPFTPGSRMYDTGDLGRWLDDGNIEFLGRNDHQVKIRGFRIELGEIESVILQYSDSLRQVVVEARDSNSEKVLVAYCVCEDELDKSALRSFLQSKLPEHMIPGYFVELPSLPVTHNGKIDRKQLPGISAADVIQKEYVAPRNNIEVKLVSIWEEILEVPKIGITDNFFAVGGHSLNAIKVITRVRNEFNIDIKIEEIFKNPTIENISAILIKNSWGTIKKEAENKPKKKILI